MDKAVIHPVGSSTLTANQPLEERTKKMTAKNYEFEHKGKKIIIPSFDSLPMGVLRKSRKADSDMDKAFIIIEELIGEDSEEIKMLDTMTPKEFQVFLEGWTQGAPVGESSGS